MRIFQFILAVFIFNGSLLAQTPSSNPFEIESRLPKSEIVAADALPTNPFDVVPHRTPGASASVLGVSTDLQSRGKKWIRFPEGNTMSTTVIFGILVGFLAFFTFAASANRSAVTKAWRSFLSSNTLNVTQRESLAFSGSTPYLLLYVSFLFNAGVFVFLTIQALSAVKKYNNMMVLLLSLGAVITLFLLKHALNGLLRWLFPSLATELSRYNFLIIVFSCILGLFLIPFNFLVAFAFDQIWQSFLTLWLLALAGIFTAYGIFRAFSLGTKFLVGYPMHFLLYLCTAEIVPFVLLYKILT